jgi:hypothetical protein
MTTGNHISADRAWTLLGGASSFTDEEKEHLHTCSECREYLRTLINLAKAAGLTVAISVPGDDKYKNSA